MSTTERTALPAPGSERPPGPYLCKVTDPLPAGWQLTRAAQQTATCLAYDPTRHTVIANIDTQNHDHLRSAVAQAGFENFQVPGTQTGFLARDRQTAPRSALQWGHDGMSR